MTPRSSHDAGSLYTNEEQKELARDGLGTVATLVGFVNVVTGTDCWTRNFSTHGRLFVGWLVGWISQCRFFLTRSLPWRHLKTTNKSEKSETCKPFCFFFALACETIFIKTRGIESRCAIGPENILFADASVHLSARTFYRLG